jgi:Trk K+ transport system NAD-binding subunit
MRMPRGAILCAILKGDVAEIPNGNSVIHAGDTVIAVATERAADRLEALFKQRAF